MIDTHMVAILGFLCYATGIAAVGVYLINILSRQGWRRPWNAAGLFFTAIALSQLPSLIRAAREIDEMRAAVIAVVALVGAAGLQAVTALRKRRARRDEGGSSADTSGDSRQ